MSAGEARGFATRAAQLAGVRGVSIGAGFLTAAIGARVLGTEGMGAAGIGLTLAAVAAVTFNGGINISTIYLLGRGADRRAELVDALVPLALAGMALAGTALLLTGGLLAPVLGMDAHGPVLAWSAGLAASLLAFEFAGALLLGLGRSRSYVALELFRGIGTLAASGLLLALWPTAAAFVVAALVAQGVGVAFAMRRVTASSGPIRPRLDMRVAGEALSIGLRGQVGNVLQFINLRLDQLLVPAFLSLGSAGVYIVAVRVSEALAQVGSAAAALVFPEVARQRDPLATDLTERALRSTLILVAGVALLMGLLAEPVLAIAFGEDFAPGADALRLLLVAMLPLTAARVLAGDLKGRGRPGLVSVAMGAAVVLTVALDVLLIPPLGIVGAALASVIAYSAVAGLLAFLFVRLTHARAVDLIPRPADTVALVRFVRRRRSSRAR